MPVFRATDPRTGQTVRLEGESPPTEAELEEIFARLPEPQARPAEADLGGAGEMALTLGTSTIAEPLAGLAGLLDLGAHGSEHAADTVQSVQSALTYDPKSEQGRAGLESLAQFLQPVSAVLGAVETGAGDAGYAVGGPAVGAVARSIPEGLMQALGIKGLRTARGASKVAGISDDVAKMAARNGIDLENPANIPQLQALTAQQAADHARRAGVFDKLGIPTTRSRVTQSQSDFLQERTLARQAGTPEGLSVQDRLMEEATGFHNVAKSLQHDLGIPAEAGDAIKEALETRLTGLKAAKNAAYEDLARLSSGKGMPLAGDAILDVLKDEKVAGMAGRLDPAARAKVNDLMVEYGLDTDAARVEDWIKRRSAVGEGGALRAKSAVTPLSVLNAEDLRTALNDLIDPMGSKELNGVAGALKRGLDEEVSAVDQALQAADKTGDLGALGKNTRDVIAAAGRARELARGLKREFSPKSLAGMLTSTQKGTFDRDLIVSSEVTKRLMSGTNAGSLENVTELMDTLAKAGEPGVKAIGNLQASVVMDLMEHATAARSAKLAEGLVDWSGTAFSKRFDQIGSKKLRRIFQSNPKALDMLENLREAGDLRTSLSAVAKSSGTADDLVNFFKSAGLLSKVAGLGGGFVGLVTAKGFETAGARLQARAARKIAQKQLRTAPDAQQVVQQVKRLYPNMAVALGIGSLYGSQDTSK